MSSLRLNLLVQPLLLDLSLVHDLSHLLDLEKTLPQFILILLISELLPRMRFSDVPTAE